jgi:hypothetical protein
LLVAGQDQQRYADRGDEVEAEDPSGNPIELFQPSLAEARLSHTP